MLWDPKEGGSLPEGIKHIDRQEDRMLIFADLGPAPLEFIWKARAASAGDYAAPAAHAEAMHKPGVAGLSDGGRLLIEDE